MPSAYSPNPRNDRTIAPWNAVMTVNIVIFLELDVSVVERWGDIFSRCSPEQDGAKDDVAYSLT